MKYFLKKNNKILWLAILVMVIIGGIVLNTQLTKAAWETPTSQPPDSNIFVPLNVGPEKQAKEGSLLLNPLYNPSGIPSTLNYPLEVAGPNDVYINNFNVLPEGNLIVDLDTLYVDGENNQVGIGTMNLTNDAKLEVSGGGVHIGQAGAGVTGIGLSVSSTAVNVEVVYGLSTAVNQASIYGLGVGSGIGVYGNNTSSGPGIYSESGNTSAVVGITSSEYSTAETKISGIYASATGLGAWAGYFEQRLFGSGEIVGRKFTQSQPNYSQVPYTSGWEVKEINDSYDTAPNHIAYDGEHFWITQWGWERTEIYLVDPETGKIAKEFIPVDTNNIIYRSVSKIMYENNYIWISGYTDFSGDGCFGRESVTRVDPGTFEVIHYPVGNCNAGYGRVVDMVYDDQTPSGPYIWTVNSIREGVYPNYIYSHTVGRLSINDGSYYASCSDPLYNNRADCETNGEVWNGVLGSDEPLTVSGQCLSFDVSNCHDGISNDSDGNTDMGCSFAGGYPNGDGFEWYIDTSAECTAVGGIWGTADIQCSDIGGQSPDGNTTLTDERLEVKEIGAPSSIIFDPTRLEVWVSFNGMNRFNGEGMDIAGEGLGKIDTTNLGISASLYCLEDSLGNPRTGRRISDLAYDSINDRIWASQAPTWVTYQGIAGISKIDPTTGQIESEYNNASGLYEFGTYLSEIQVDEWSPGGPFIFTGGLNDLHKFDIADEVIENDYVIPDSIADFMISRIDPANLYIWGAHSGASLLSKSEVNNPYDVDTFVLKGSDSSDIVFDGTNIWTANEDGSSISKYRISDGEKIGDYQVGRHPQNMAFDGVNLWIDSASDPQDKHLTQIRASDGELIGDYDKGDDFMANDTVFDGRYLWMVGHSGNDFHKVDTLDCVDLDGSGSGVGSCPNVSYAGTLNNPRSIIYDGEFLWTFNLDNTFTKISISDNDTPDNIVDDNITVIGTYTFSIPLNTSNDNINVMKYDGTYIWFGTDHVDAEGNSVFKFNPAECDTGTCLAAGKYKIYHEPGRCSAGSINENLICIADNECGTGFTCDITYSNVTGMVFDGINIWTINSAHGNSTPRECNDGINNDGVGHCTASPYDICSDDFDCDPTGICSGGSNPGDVCTELGSECLGGGVCESNETCDLIDEIVHYGGWCENSYDWREGSRCNDQQDNDKDGLIDMDDPDCIASGINSDAEGNPECSDGLDNDGNGLCDFDGAAGAPGCSGKPDPGCESANDIGEYSYYNSAYLTKIIATTGEIVESVPVGTYCSVAEMAFDGNSVWFGSSCDLTVLNQYYVGDNLGTTDFSGLVSLQGSTPGTTQSGNFSITGDANFGEKLVVVNDLVVRGNVWGGATDTIKSYGTSCDNGEFVKGIDNSLSNLHCRSL